VFFLAIFAGAVQTFEMPARQSFLTDIVGKEDLTSAVALNSALVNGARIIGPALAGAVVAQVGEGACFLINAISYLAIIGGFLAMRLPARSATVADNISIAAFMREGVVYAIRTPVIRLLLVLIGLASFLSTPYTVLMPIFAGDILHGGPSGMGMLMGAAGFGAVVGVMFLARHHTTEKIAGTIVFALIRFGIGLILFGFSRNFWLSMLLLPLVGSGFMLPMSAANTLLQILTPDHLRGRVMSIFFIVFMGTPPLGSLLAGFLAPHIGAPLTVAGTGVLCLAGAAWFALKVHLLREAAEEEKRGETVL
jgi:MFS family permease